MDPATACATSRLRRMIERAWEWAKKNGRLRVNPVHGEEEINIVLSETFQLENMDVEENNRTGSFEVQAGGIRSIEAYSWPPLQPPLPSSTSSTGWAWNAAREWPANDWRDLSRRCRFRPAVGRDYWHVQLYVFQVTVLKYMAFRYHAC